MLTNNQILTFKVLIKFNYAIINKASNELKYL